MKKSLRIEPSLTEDTKRSIVAMLDKDCPEEMALIWGRATLLKAMGEPAGSPFFLPLGMTVFLHS